MKKSLHNIPLRVALGYLVIAGLYIFFSDRLLDFLISDVEKFMMAQTIKGWLFVLVTGVALFFDLRRRIALLIEEKHRSEEAHRALEQSEALYRNMAAYSPIAKFVILKGEVVYVNQACQVLFGAETAQDLLGLQSADLFHPEGQAHNEQQFASLKKVGDFVLPYPEKIIRLDGRNVDVEVSASLFPYEHQQAVHVDLMDFTDLVSAKRTVEQQLAQLRSLYEIDQAILSSFDLDYVMTVSLKHLIELLHVDAVSVIEITPNDVYGKLIKSVGFRQEDRLKEIIKIDGFRLRQVLQDKQRLLIGDLRADSRTVFKPDWVDAEGMVFYCAVPLISKGKIIGLLELFTRTPHTPEEDWFELLENLAGQISIAMDQVHLQSDLRRSLLDLSLAYDRTIEGWSQTLDLRDNEHEGHSQRVADISIELGQKFALSDEQLMHLRRGALLHDIGKMVIPDRILYKPEKLTEEEWHIVQQHPQVGFEMLSSIDYLRPALDIPYCHHEKWDGTGFPRGLKGKQIPLQARIFAVADAWDTLRSDQPYRAALSDEQGLAHVRSQAGKQFDPDVVKVFLDWVADGQPSGDYTA